MNEAEALQRLKAMSDAEFDDFFKLLPPRVQLCVKGGLVDWREALPQWYIKKLVTA